jgi:hypothetical protein
LSDHVLAREIRRSRYVKTRKDAEGVPIKQTLGISAIKGYIAVIVDLWSFQKSNGLNSYPNPHGEALNGLLKARSHGEHKRRRLEFADRAAGTLQNGYDEAKMIEAIRFCWQGQKQSTEPYLRTLVDFLLAHNILLRSESRLAAELADFFTIPLPNEGPTPCYPMIMIMGNSKMNQQGRLEYGAVMRHRNPLLCTMSHTAFYLLYRWNIAGEAKPCFRHRQHWYNLHLIKGEDATKKMAYDTQLDWINKMFAGANVMSLKKTHAGRSQGAKHAELNGVNEGQIRRAGRWNNDALTSCYLTHLPRKFMRSMAGFNPSVQGNFYLPRARILPPRSLEQAVWPFVDEWLAWFDATTTDDKMEGSCSYISPPTPTPCNCEKGAAEAGMKVEADHQDLAAQGFLRLLKQLRIILLQDSVIMRCEFPAHPLWADPVFERDDYQVFAKDVELSLLEVEEPEDVQIRRTIPAIAERLNTLHQGLSHDVNEWGTKTKEQLDSIDGQLKDLFEGRISMTLSSTRTVLQPQPTATKATIIPTLTPASVTTTPPFHSAPTSPFLSAAPLPSRGTLSLSHSRPFSLSGEESHEPPSYLLSRTVSTVPQLWREWTVGLGGGPSVQGLEDLYGPSWRLKHSEKVLYGRRKVIIDEIRRRQSEGISVGAAVEELELIRQRGRLSLYQLYQLLNRQKGERQK